MAFHIIPGIYIVSIDAIFALQFLWYYIYNNIIFKINDYVIYTFQSDDNNASTLLTIEESAAISMEQWQEGITIKQEPIAAQSLSMDQWEAG